MRVLSPVGTFPLSLKGIRLADGRPVVDTAMGAWRSEIRLDRHDVPLVAVAVGLIAASFLLGRVSRSGA
jgi:hypothetical protein